jgi:hypothetical protein
LKTLAKASMNSGALAGKFATMCTRRAAPGLSCIALMLLRMK